MTHGIGIIGTGIMGRRMAERIRVHPRFALVASWDPDPAARAAFAESYPRVDPAPSAAALAARPDVACVYIASPPAAHVEHANAAFDAGKAVFCEKPLAVDLDAAAALVARAERENRVAGVNFSLAGAPSFRAIADAAASGALGAITAIDITVRFARWPRPWQQGAASWLAGGAEGGFVREVVSHFIFTTQRLVGPLTVETTAVERAGGGAERAIRARASGGGAVVTVDGRIEGDADDRNLWTVAFARGALRLRDWYRLERRDGERWAVMEGGSVDSLRAAAGQAQLDALAARLDGRAGALPSLREGLDVQRTIETLLRG